MGLLDVIGAQAQGSLTGVVSPAARVVEQTANEALANVLPDAAALFRAEIAGTISRPQAARWLQWAGVSPPANWFAGRNDPNSYNGALSRMWQGVYDAGLSVPSPGELLTLLNRGSITTEAFHSSLKRQGFGELHVRNWLLSLKDDIPGASDLIRYAVKEVWDQQATATFGYDQEFPAALQYWMAKQGLGGSSAYKGPDGRDVPGPNWPLAEWIAHWQNVSPGQGYEMFQRLRPNRIHRFAGTIPNLTPFTFNTLKTLLKVNDYPPFVRSWLAAIAYRLPRLLDIEHWHLTGTIDDDELYEQHLDLGYDPDSANLRTGYLIRQKKAKLTREARGNARAKVLAAYQIGSIDRDEAGRLLFGLFVVGKIEETPWNLFNTEQQIAHAKAHAPTQAALDDVDLAEATATLKAKIAGIRKSFLRGRISELDASAALQSAGVVRGRMRGYLERWTWERNGGMQLVSAAKIQKLLRERIISPQVADAWLANLNWGPDERRVLLAEVNRNIALDVAKIQQQQATSQKQREAALAKQVKALESQKKQALAQLTRQASDAKLTRWYVRGIISADVLRTELARRQYQEPYLSAMIADAESQRRDRLDAQRRAAEKEAKANQPPQGAGDGEETGPADEPGQATATQGGNPTVQTRR